MKVLVCGGRDFDDWHSVDMTLQNILYEHYGCWRDVVENSLIITGDACGADWLARAWAKSCGIDYKGYPADWKKYKRAAGAIRNHQMLEEGQPDIVVAFPGGAGTADMVNKAKKAGLKVIEVFR